MSKKSAIPAVRTGQPDMDRALAAIKQNLDAITGQSRNTERLEPLASTATTAEVVARLNQLLERLQ